MADHFAIRGTNDGSIRLDFPSEAATSVILADSDDDSPAEEDTMQLLRDGLGLHEQGQVFLMQS